MMKSLILLLAIFQTTIAQANHRKDNQYDLLGEIGAGGKKAKKSTDNRQLRLLTNEVVSTNQGNSAPGRLDNKAASPLETQTSEAAQNGTQNAAIPVSESISYTERRDLDNGTRVTVSGKDKEGLVSITGKGGIAKAREVPIEGDVLKAFQQAKFREEGVNVSLTQALGIKSPQAANIVAFQFEKSQGLTSFFGIPPEKFNYYYPTNRQMQQEMNAGADAQMNLVFYKKLPDGSLTPWAGGGMGGGNNQPPA